MLVRCEIQNQIALVTIDNPPANSLNADTLTTLQEVLEPCLSDEEVRVLVITGAGRKIFVAGADINQLRGLDQESGERLVIYCKEVFSLLQSSAKPVIAAINGIAAGGGLELALCCDIRVAAAHARLGLPEASLGVLPAAGGTQLLPRLIGAGQAMRLMLTGELITAELALELGVVEEVVPGDSLMDRVMNLAQQIAAMPPLAVAEIKAAVQDSLWQPLAQGMANETTRFGRLCITEDKQEGVEAFLRGRRPHFKGQ